MRVKVSMDILFYIYLAYQFNTNIEIIKYITNQFLYNNKFITIKNNYDGKTSLCYLSESKKKLIEFK